MATAQAVFLTLHYGTPATQHARYAKRTPINFLVERYCCPHCEYCQEKEWKFCFLALTCLLWALIVAIDLLASEFHIVSTVKRRPRLVYSSY